MARKYTPEEKKYIEKNYQTLTDAEMAEALGRSPKNIGDFRNKYGYNRYPRKPTLQRIQRQTFKAQRIERDLTEQEEADIIADLKRGFRYGELAADYGVPAGVVKKLRERIYDKQAA